MKIVLTHGYFLSDDEKEKEIMRPYPPLGILYISSFLKDQGKDVTIIDSTFLNKEEWWKEVQRVKPNVLACYTNLMTKVNMISLVQKFKKEYPNAKTVCGGPDVTYNIKNYLSAGFDFAIFGEGEQTITELIEAVEKDSPLTEITGIAYLEGSEVIKTNARIKIKEMKSLPLPDRSGIPIEKYLDVWKEHHGFKTVNISTQRGCPYTCQWCSTAVYGQSYRRNAPERVVQEILSLKNDFGVEALWFVDDVFTVSHKWINDLHAEFQKHDLSIPFECITRAERLNEKVLTQLKEMGCFRIWIGAESGSQRIIDKMDRRVTLETVQEMINKTQSMGMEAGTFIMVGYPEEEHEDIVATLKHIQACNPKNLTITKAYPIKGTGLYEEIESRITTNLNWEVTTDRDIRFELPYSDRYYNFAIRYLVNGWKAKRDKSLKSALKSKAAYYLMKFMR